MCAVSNFPKVITMLTAAHLLNWSVDIIQHNPLAQDAFVTSWLHVKNSIAVKIGILTAVDTSLYHFDSCWYIAVSFWHLLILRCIILTAVDTWLHHFDNCWYIAAPFWQLLIHRCTISLLKQNNMKSLFESASRCKIIFSTETEFNSVCSVITLRGKRSSV